jgi:hypothetical protein
VGYLPRRAVPDLVLGNNLAVMEHNKTRADSPLGESLGKIVRGVSRDNVRI